MSRILMTWELGGGLGHLVPLHDIARKLVRQGHQVALAARELTHVPMVFGDLPVTLFQAPFQQGLCPGGVFPAATFAHILFNTGFGNPLSIQAHCQAWQSIYTAWKPDFVLFDHSPMAMLAARDRHFSRATIGSGFWLPTRTDGMPDWRTWQPSDPAKLAYDENQTLNSVNAALRKMKKSELKILTELFTEVDQTFAITYAELDPFPHRDEADYFGYWTSQLDWPDRDANVSKTSSTKIFAYLKDFPARDVLIHCLIELGLPTIVYSPSAAASPVWKARGLHELRLVDTPVDSQQLCERCDLVIGNGGHGLLVQSLLAGTPVLSFPLTLDQRLHAEKCQSLGAGISRNPNVCTGILEQIRFLLDESSFSASASAFREKHNSRNESRTNLDGVVDRIVEML